MALQRMRSQFLGSFREAIRRWFLTSIWLLFATEAFLVMIYFLANPREFLQPQNLVYSLSGIVLVLLLAILHEKKVPFQYTVKLSSSEHIVWTSVPFLGMVVIVSIVRTIFNLPNLLPSAGDLFGAALASITEESLKVVMINGFAIAVSKMWTHGIIRPYVIWIVGIMSVVFWTLGHIPYVHYGLVKLSYLFLGGMIMFYVTYRKQSFFPAIYIHTLWNTFFS